MENYFKKDIATFENTRNALQFLCKAGFKLKEQKSPEMMNRGPYWFLLYESNNVSVHFVYSDFQLEIKFKRGEVEADYFMIDKIIFNCAIGYQGNMFSGPSLDMAIDNICKNIEKNYRGIYNGEDAIWKQIDEIVAQQSWKNKKKSEAFHSETARREAQEAFKRKDYFRVVEIFEKLKHNITPSELKKLEYAKKLSKL